MKKIVLLISSIFILSCQTKPTKVFESQETRLRDGEKVKIQKESIMVDARPPFEYSVSHINGSINIRWDEFTQPEEAYRGVFEADLYFQARRLARLGIDPQTPVVVVGRGPLGAGEEGRLAWTLKYLGIKDVRFVHIDGFDRPPQKEEAPAAKAKPIWKPELDESLLVRKSDFLKKIQILKTEPDAPHLIDVRPVTEYLGQTPSRLAIRPPDFGAINIPWTEFINSQGLARPEVKEQLIAVGLNPDHEIMVISNRGVESATVTLVLRELGFAKAANVGGGYSEILTESVLPRKKKQK